MDGRLALAGAVDAAEEHVQRAGVQKTVSYDRQMIALAKALVEFQRIPLDKGALKFRSLRRQLAKRFSILKMPAVARDVRHVFERAGNVFAREGPRWPARLWFGCRLSRQWCCLPLCLRLPH